MDRRSFLKNLVASAIATQLPGLPKAQAAALETSATNALIGTDVNGRPPDSLSIQDMGGGWFRHVARFRSVGDGESFSISFAGNGLYVGEDEHASAGYDAPGSGDFVVSFDAKVEDRANGALVHGLSLLKDRG